MGLLADNIVFRNLDFIWKNKTEYYFQPSSLQMTSDKNFAVLFVALTFRCHINMTEISMYYRLLLIALQSLTMNQVSLRIK